ncbi:aldehyde dehydrogenase family protein [Miltoncostaea marina]|uniref:aldehyde dehydrogenase family protein n=1 Tax=Miltoncostaea marina TaxID=2843215 RepID=UPI001C3D207F|nr:aldehyde dehydrogenase family protein [Miltoncostaea marina]
MGITSPALDPSQPTGLLLDGAFDQRNEDLAVTNPYSGETIATVAVGGPDDVAAAVDAAMEHLPPPPAAERAQVLERAARLVAERADAFARTICLEAGKPLKQARAEVARCVDTLTFAAVEARKVAGEMVPMDASAAGAGKLGVIVREPIGVVGAISPFNFPLNLVAHKVAPAIAAGCPVVLKPASATPLSALLLARTLGEAGLPPGALSVVIGGGGTVGNALVDHPDVPMISFTGSPPVGWDIRQRQPRKEVALELGNSTPVIVEADADLELAATKLAASGFTHAGQSCISVQRVYVQERAIDRFRDLFVAAVGRLVVGDPMDERTDVGPLIDDDNRQRVVDWIDEARDSGGEVLTGGEVRDRLLMPTVIEGIDPSMKVSCEEVFGPVVGLASYGDIDQALELANSSPFGLQAGIFTARADAALVWARRLHFGGVLVNETPTFRADQMPYGGVKDSGNTREGPRFAVESMTEPKLLVVALPQ